MKERQTDPGSKAGTTNKRKPPRWVVPFLRALERTGVARAAAEDAGVDHTTAYVRRRTHAEFADAWAEALQARAARLREEKAKEPAAPAASTASGGRAPADTLGEELFVSGGQLKRASGERWGKRKQEVFLAELAASANVRRACKAVGLSKQALLKRRHKDPYLAAAWDAAIEVGK